MRIKCVASRRLSFVAAGSGFLASAMWLVPAIVLGMPSVWAIGGAPFMILGVVFYLRGRRIPVTTLSAMWLVLGLSSSLPAQQTGQDQREQIGVVLGKPVYRDRLKTTSLEDLFRGPVERRYRQAHRAAIEPTEAEIRAATEFIEERHSERIEERGPEYRRRLAATGEQLARTDLTEQERKKLLAARIQLQAQLDPPDWTVALVMLKPWKFQKHVYDKYGGGRVLWTPVGVIAIDAMRTWLKDQEKKGHFSITDPKLRSSFYERWDSYTEWPFPADVRARIRHEFLEPEWRKGARPALREKTMKNGRRVPFPQAEVGSGRTRRGPAGHQPRRPQLDCVGPG